MKISDGGHIGQVVEGTIIPLRDNVMAYGMYFGDRVRKSGLIIRGDDATEQGIRPRWCKVLSVGPKQKDIEPDMWILVAHGRWTRHIKQEINGNIEDVRGIDAKDILGYQWENPDDDQYTDMAQGYS